MNAAPGMANGHTPVNLARVVRDCLLAVEDPESADGLRLLAMARARCAHLGADPVKLTKYTVHQARRAVRLREGAPLTPEKVRAYCDRLDGKPADAPMPPRPVPPAHDPARDRARLVEAGKVLKLAAEFVAAVGGLGNARVALGALEDLSR